MSESDKQEKTQAKSVLRQNHSISLDIETCD